MMNKALLSQWNWQSVDKRVAFQKQVIIHKYRRKLGGWGSKEVGEGMELVGKSYERIEIL